MPYVSDQQAEVSAPKQVREATPEYRIYEALLDIIQRLERIELALQAKRRPK